MATYVNLTDVEPSTQLASLLAQIECGADDSATDARTARAAELASMASDNGIVSFLENGFYKALPTIMSGDDRAAVNTAINLVLAVLQDVEPEVATEHLRKLSKLLAQSPEQHAFVKLKLLTILFNSIDTSARLDVFEDLTQFAIESKNTVVLAGQFDRIDSWVESWGLDADGAAKLYLQCAKVCKYNDQAEEQQKHLLNYFRALEGAPADLLATAKPYAVQATIAAIKSSEAAECSKLLQYEAVTQLDGDAEHAATFALLDVLTSQDVPAFVAWAEKHKGHLSSLNIEYDTLLAKTRSLSLCALALEQEELEYATIQKALEIVDEDEVERQVIEAVMSGVIDAKIDQHRKVIIVSNATPPKFTQATWNELHSRLGAWRDNVQNVLSVLVHVREQQAQHQEEMLAGDDNDVEEEEEM
jgi:translation initiation factor 3 subunit M